MNPLWFSVRKLFMNMHRLSLKVYLRSWWQWLPLKRLGDWCLESEWEENELFTVYSFIQFNLFLTKHMYYEFKWIKRKLLKASVINNYQWIICNSPHDQLQYTSASRITTKQSAEIQTWDFWLQVRGFPCCIAALRGCSRGCTLPPPTLLRPALRGNNTTTVRAVKPWLWN